MIFIIDLSESKSYNTILIIINRLIKIKYYIKYKVKEEEISAEQIVQIYIKYIWKYYKLLKSIISDRDLQFILIFWMNVYRMLKIKIKLSTAFYSQTDRQNKVVNKKIKKYL